jgi:hypothetical protein
MSEPAPIDVPRQRRRLIAMVIVDGICFAVALAAIVGDFGFHVVWMRWLFLGAVVAGFVAQGWLIAGLAGKK